MNEGLKDGLREAGKIGGSEGEKSGVNEGGREDWSEGGGGVRDERMA